MDPGCLTCVENADMLRELEIRRDFFPNTMSCGLQAVLGIL